MILLNLKFVFLMCSHILAGVSKLLDDYIGLLGQPRYVEHEVCNMGKAVPWATILSQGLDSGSQLCQ
jgi:hypothetical protein